MSGTCFNFENVYPRKTGPYFPFRSQRMIMEKTTTELPIHSHHFQLPISSQNPLNYVLGTSINVM